MQQWVTFWRLAGAEGLCVTALGFRTLMQLHLPLQSACLALTTSYLPAMCGQCYPATPWGLCVKSSVVAAAMLGHLAPTLLLRRQEQRWRAQFAGQLRAAVAREA